MNKVLALFAVVMMSLVGFNTAQADARDELIAAVKTLNDSCPMGDDVVMKSVKVEGDNLVYTYVMQVSKAELDMVKNYADDVVEGIAADFRADEVMRPIYELCKTAKCNLVVRFSNSQGQYVDLKLPNSKM